MTSVDPQNSQQHTVPDARRTPSPTAIKTVLTFGMTGIATAASAATITVNSTADNTVSGDGHCTLREAINNANAHGDTTGGDCAAATPGSNVVDLTGLSGTITLNGTQLRIAESVVINGPGSGSLTVDARNLSRAFYLFRPSTPADVTIGGMTLNRGFTPPGKQGATIENVNQNLTLNDITITGSKPESGVIANLGGVLTMTNSTVTGNTGGTTGSGAIYSKHGTLSISDSTISSNAGQNGGAILSNGDQSITLSNTSIDHNTASNRGGGIVLLSNQGSVSISHSTVTHNSAGSGGGVSIQGAAKAIDITDSSIASNTASYAGGGIFFYRGSSGGALTIERTTISGNQSSGSHDGGGIFLYRTNATMLVQNSTIASNTAGRSGGGLFLKGSFGGSQQINIFNSTIASNKATTAGGNIDGGSSASNIDIEDSIVAGGSAAAGPDIASHSADVLVNYSLIQNDTGATLDGASTHNLLNVDPQLSALAANGGPTDTMALASTSPAVDAAHNSAGLTVDQRGSAYPRPAFSASDMGAFEYQGPLNPPATSGTFSVPPYETRYLRGLGTVTMQDNGSLFLMSADALVGSTVTLPASGHATLYPTFVAGANTVTLSSIGASTKFTMGTVDSITFNSGSAAVKVSGKSTGPTTFTAYAGDTLQFSQDGTFLYAKVADSQIGGAISSGVTGLTLNPPTVKVDGTSPHLTGARLDTGLFSALNSALGVTATSTSINAQGTLVLNTAGGSYAYAPTQILVNPAAPDINRLDSGNLQLRVGTLQVNLVPTVVDPTSLISSLKSITGLTTIVERASDGSLHLQPGSLLFTGLPGTISSSTQAAGLYANARYADLADGNGQAQRIYSTFYDPSKVTAALKTIDASATLSMGADGIANVTLLGQKYLFTPDWQLQSLPYQHLSDSYWTQGSEVCLNYGNFRYQCFSITLVSATR